MPELLGSGVAFTARLGAKGREKRAYIRLHDMRTCPRGKAAPDRCENCGVGGELIEERRPALTRTWVCTVCGLKIKSENAPEKCPKCESPAELFKAQKDGIARMRCSICGFEIEATQRPTAAKTVALTGICSSP